MMDRMYILPARLLKERKFKEVDYYSSDYIKTFCAASTLSRECIGYLQRISRLITSHDLVVKAPTAVKAIC